MLNLCQYDFKIWIRIHLAQKVKLFYLLKLTDQNNQFLNLKNWLLFIKGKCYVSRQKPSREFREWRVDDILSWAPLLIQFLSSLTFAFIFHLKEQQPWTKTTLHVVIYGGNNQSFPNQKHTIHNSSFYPTSLNWRCHRVSPNSTVAPSNCVTFQKIVTGN